VSTLLLNRTARDKIYGKLNRAGRAAKSLEHAGAEISSPDAHVTILNQSQALQKNKTKKKLHKTNG